MTYKIKKYGIIDKLIENKIHDYRKKQTYRPTKSDKDRNLQLF